MKHNPISATCGATEGELQSLGAAFVQCIPFADDDDGQLSDLLAQLDRVELAPREETLPFEVRLAA